MLGVAQLPETPVEINALDEVFQWLKQYLNLHVGFAAHLNEMGRHS